MNPIRILLVEDSSTLMGAVAHELETTYGYHVTTASGAVETHVWLANGGECDVVVADLLFTHTNLEFVHRINQGLVGVYDKPLLQSGLAVIAKVRAQHPTTQAVIWTSGEPNRRLHLVFAEQELGVRSFCSKSPTAGGVEDLHHAIESASRGIAFADSIINPYLSPPQQPKLGDKLLGSTSKRRIWRALALGADSRERAGQLTNYAGRSVGNDVGKIYEDLAILDPGYPRENRQPFVSLVRYASSNWEFFLDEAVRQTFPP